MAAGVGKTRAMLQAARRRQADGVDVVAGCVETHGQAEAEALLAGLPTCPRRDPGSRPAARDEMDLDALLARQPRLALVDDLARANPPGSRHPKRYQDVIELLDAGIDVYTTVNVQHLESRADTVRQITGVAVRETVPDSLVEQASAIELVDLSPEELLRRLAEGKVHTGEGSELAAQGFFRLGNLTALREMALRLTAERVDHQLRDYMQVKRIAGPWKSGERLMVAVSAAASSERLVRWARRMAYNLEAPWLAVYVETSRELSEEEKARLARVLALAQELGAEVVTTTGEDVPRALVRVAQQRNVTQIVVGKPERGQFQRLLGSARIVDRLIQESGAVDIYVATGELDDRGARQPRLPARAAGRAEWGQYGRVLAVAAATTALNLILSHYIGYRAAALLYLLAVSIVGLFMSRGPVLVMATLSAVLWNFLFIPPRLTFYIHDVDDVLMYVMYFAVALITGTLTSRLRAQEKAVRQREERATAMYALAREVASALTLDDVLRTAAKQIGQAFNADVAFLLAGDDGRLLDRPHPMSTLAPAEKEMPVASLAFERQRAAGQHTDTLPQAEAHWLPLRVPSGVAGVMGVRAREGQRLNIDQQTLLETFAGQIALAIERERLDEAAERARVAMESERLSRTLLNSVSHELRTPIATITGAATSLLDEKVSRAPGLWAPVVGEIQVAADRLNRVVENLLGMTRLESGRLKPKLEWCEVGDLVSVAVHRVTADLARHELTVDVAPDLPLVRLDFVMLEQALINLLHNAAAYTPPGTPVRVAALADGADLVLSVTDRGPGLPADVERVFEKFYRAPGVKPGGMGLGLAIARGLVEAHGGTITAENGADGGACFTIRLPLGQPPVVPREGSE